MKNASAVRERILTTTMALIRAGNGNAADLTTRAIAQEAHVGVGLINYHFQSKENLITQSVQLMIAEVVSGFAPAEKRYANDQERLTDWAALVFDFLFENPSLSRISILADLSQYTAENNTVRSQIGFSHALGSDLPTKDKALLTFLLTSAMQVAFLGDHDNATRLGFDFATTQGRRDYISRLVSVLYNGILSTTIQEG